MAIFSVGFAVYLDPNQRGLALMSKQLTEREVFDWMVLPISGLLLEAMLR